MGIMGNSWFVHETDIGPPPCDRQPQISGESRSTKVELRERLAYAESRRTDGKAVTFRSFHSMQDVLRDAISSHQAGDLARAGSLYQNVLASEPDNAEAMHLLGVLNHQQGAHARAVELMGRAVAHQAQCRCVSRQPGRSVPGARSI